MLGCDKTVENSDVHWFAGFQKLAIVSTEQTTPGRTGEHAPIVGFSPHLVEEQTDALYYPSRCRKTARYAGIAKW